MDERQYDQVRERIKTLQHRFRDSVDKRDDPSARQLENDLSKLENDLQSRKNPRSIEQLAISLERSFNSLNDPQVMDKSDADEFVDQMREVRSQIRQFDNF